MSLDINKAYDKDTEIVVSVTNLTKKYRIGLKEERYDKLSEKLTYLLMSPFRKLKEIRSLSNLEKNESSIHVALKNINLKVNKGEIVGIIGRNGAGKSTILKILSRVTSPTSGDYTIIGRVASLLEVGTGFHPELTGRENVYLNGTILGMKKKEVDNKFNSIVSFSGVESFIDTPIKRYSSGMRVRLAFAVAAHLEPDVLIIDEVLAVGDNEFQKKCLGKMNEIASEGRTVLFVSHNMGSVNDLCDRVIVLNDGEVVFNGNTEKGIAIYNGYGIGDYNYGVNKDVVHRGEKNDFCYLKNIKCVDQSNKEKYFIEINEEHMFVFDYSLLNNTNSFVVSCKIQRNGIDLFYTLDTDFNNTNERDKGLYQSSIVMPSFFLKEGDYSISLYFKNSLDGSWLNSYENVLTFSVVSNSLSTLNKGYYEKRAGVVVFQGTWKNTLIKT
jgi:lipopolysaccharide transport system ATP-binding protein